MTSGMPRKEKEEVEITGRRDMCTGIFVEELRISPSKQGRRTAKALLGQAGR